MLVPFLLFWTVDIISVMAYYWISILTVLSSAYRPYTLGIEVTVLSFAYLFHMKFTLHGLTINWYCLLYVMKNLLYYEHWLIIVSVDDIVEPYIVMGQVVHVSDSHYTIKHLTHPHRGKTWPYGHIVFILGLGVSKGVHNIAFSVTLDTFATELLLLLLKCFYYYIKCISLL